MFLSSIKNMFLVQFWNMWTTLTLDIGKENKLKIKVIFFILSSFKWIKEL